MVKSGNSNFTFEAEANRTYYIGAECYGDTGYTLTLTKFVPTVTEIKDVTGDVNGSGMKDIIDVLALLKYVAGIEESVVY